MPLYEFEGKRPVIAKSSFIHPQAVIIGDVIIGENCLIGAGAVLRGDFGKISVGSGTNVQDNAVIHVEPYTDAIIKENCLIGHLSLVHGPCIVHENVIVGMSSTICNQCELEEGSMLAAGSVLPPGKKIPARKLAMGNPARVVKDLNEQLMEYNKIAVRVYQELADRCLAGLKLIEE